MTRLDSVKIIVPNNCLELTSDSYHTTLKNRNELITEDSFTFNKLGQNTCNMFIIRPLICDPSTSESVKIIIPP